MITTHHFRQMKEQGRKISMITCYDSWSAKIINETPIDCVLVGDSLAMVMHGHSTTLPATTELMATHTAAVVRGAPQKFIIGDLPFISYRKDLASSVEAAGQIMRAGAHAVKLEGAKGNLEMIRHLVDSGIPVMAHLGLTPQSIHQLGGFKVQGRTPAAHEELKKEALQVQQAGAFAVVLECVPQALANEITAELEIPTIGIGAGLGTDGQVLVLQDMLGLNPNFQARFVRKYLDGFRLLQQALTEYHQDVTQKQFPSETESYL
jgi:3-methyl-2-oxobutanoate hydroxymethyltransferase